MLTLNTNIMSLTTQNYLNITGLAMTGAAERLAAASASTPPRTMPPDWPSPTG